MWLKRQRAITLIELLIATVVFAIIISATIVGMRFMSRLRIDREAYEPALAGARALEYVFVRVLRSDGKTHQITDGGQGLKFKVIEEAGGERWAKFSLDAQQQTLLYDYNLNDSTPAEIVVRGIKNATFKREDGDRISVELEVSTEDIFQTVLKRLSPLVAKEAFAVEVSPSTLKLRTSVRSRSATTPLKRIN